jgi:MoaA/NifB/PqqE/SkfB family radical SAM enzyme
MNDLIKRSQYGANYIPDIEDFRKRVKDKTIVPHQVEFQPGPSKGRMCWLRCPYCYGVSAMDTGERMDSDRLVEILEQVYAGGVKKVIFAGYCTDPLNADSIEDLLSVAIMRNMVWGFNTKALKVSKRILTLLSDEEIVPNSYISVSVDAGNNDSYNRVHGVSNGSAWVYEKVLRNVRLMSVAREASGGNWDISATYLVSKLNSSKGEVQDFISDFRDAGCGLIRFAFAQSPRGTTTDDLIMVPGEKERNRYRERLLPVIQAEDGEQCRIIFSDSGTDVFPHDRTLPCVARWVYPTVGFDGWLYHCSQSSAPNFRRMALGDLNKRDFWEVFYDYKGKNDEEWMEGLGCRCDRKEHALNRKVGEK